MGKIDPAALKSLLDSEPERFKYFNVEPDGYSPTGQLWNILRHPVGEIPNPDPPAQIPVPFSAADLTATASIALKQIPAAMLEPFISLFERQDRSGIEYRLTILLGCGVISESDADAITSVTNKTMDDPNWPAVVPGPSDLATKLGVVDIDDVSVQDEIAIALGRK